MVRTITVNSIWHKHERLLLSGHTIWATVFYHNNEIVLSVDMVVVYYKASVSVVSIWTMVKASIFLKLSKIKPYHEWKQYILHDKILVTMIAVTFKSFHY